MNNEEIQNINELNEDGLTKLHVAIKNSDINRMKELIKQGADINIRAEYNYSPIEYACLNNNYEAVKILLYNKVETKGRGLLHIACLNGNTNIENLLIKNGCNVNEFDKYNRTPAYWAIQGGSLKCLKMLYENGANFKLRKCGDENLLYFAVGEGKIEIVKYLINIGMDKYINDIEFPLLILATNYNNKEMVKLLIKYNINVDLKDENGNTALINSVEQAKYEITEVLLENNANPYITNKERERYV